jgi:DNA-binding NarL/FixJ family response regulator
MGQSGGCASRFARSNSQARFGTAACVTNFTFGLPERAEAIVIKSSKLISVAIVEDDSTFIEQVRLLLDQAADIQLLAEHGSAEEALDHLSRSRPDVVLMDLELPGISGAECTRRLKYALPRTQVIILTVKEDTSAVFESLMAGATGYLAKRADVHRLADCIREIMAGGSPMSAGIARKAIQLITRQGPPRPNQASLSERERLVLELLSRGFLYKEVGEELGIQIDTVRNHVRRIYDKLQARNRTEAILKYRSGA